MTSYADDPRAIYREIYAQITSAETKAGAGQNDVAAKEFQEVLYHLENFQKQFPDWEPEIVKFRIQYAKNQIKSLQKTSAPEQPALAQTPPPPAPAPQPIAAAPVPSQPTPQPVASITPTPAPVAQQAPPPLPAPAPIAQNPVAPTPPQPAIRPTKILPLPEPEKIAPPPTPEPIAQIPAPQPQPQTVSAPAAPQPQPQLLPPAQPQQPAPTPAPAPVAQQPTFPLSTPGNLVLSQPAIASPYASLSTANLQSMAKEIEGRVAKLESENKTLRAALAEAQSRADVSSSYVKVLTRENEFLQDKLNRELRKLEELRQILSNEFAEHSTRWNALQMRVKELINSPDISAPQTMIVPAEGQPTYTLPNSSQPEPAPASQSMQQPQQPSQPTAPTPTDLEESGYKKPTLFEVTLSTRE